jgi:hypothetical protein
VVERADRGDLRGLAPGLARSARLRIRMVIVATRGCFVGARGASPAGLNGRSLLGARLTSSRSIRGFRRALSRRASRGFSAMVLRLGLSLRALLAGARPIR